MVVRTLLFALLTSLSLTLSAQGSTSSGPTYTLQRVTGAIPQKSALLTACAPGESNIEILSCTGETSGNGDNDPGNGAFMTWRATGSGNFYFSQIYNGTDTFQIIRTGTDPGQSVYAADASGVYEANLAIGTGANGCLEAGMWTVRVWDVMDADGNLIPDRDDDGEIIGCWVECTYDFQPTCSTDTSPAATGNVTDVSCNGDDGSITGVNVDNSRFYCEGVLTYEWTGPDGFTSNNRNIDDLVPGEYSLYVEDIYGCPNTTVFTVGEADNISISCEIRDTTSTPNGNDGQIRVTIMNRTGNFTINWVGPGTDRTRDNQFNNNQRLNDIRVGTYTITVTDEETGCVATCQVTMPEPPCEIDFDITYTSDADGITDININSITGFPFYRLTYAGPTSGGPINLFNGNPFDLGTSNFTFGTYTFTLTEQNRPSCSITKTIELLPPDCSDLMLVDMMASPPTCTDGNDGSITLTIAGDDNPAVEWSTGAMTPMITGLTPDTYTATITDDKGCELIVPVVVSNPSPFTLACSSQDISANGLTDGSITLDFSGSFPPIRANYTATDPDGNLLPSVGPINVTSPYTFDNLEAGTYNIVLTNNNGCTATCTQTIIEPEVCNIDVQCAAIQPTMAGGNGGVTITFAAPGIQRSYQVVDLSDNSVVTGDLADGTSYIATDLPPGNYRVEAIDFGGCTGQCEFTINPIACNLSFDGVTTDQIICPGETNGSISFTVSGGNGTVTLDWNVNAYDGQSVVNDLPPGTYLITATDAAGCSEQLGPIDLIDPTPIDPVISQTGQVDCDGGVATLTVTNSGGVAPLFYRWSEASFGNTATVTNAPAGTYTVEIIDGNGCRDTSVQFTVDEPAPINLTCTPTAETLAGAVDGQLAFAISGGTAPYDNFTLNGTPVTRPAGDVFTGLAPGDYRLEFTDANGCPASCEQTINPGGCGPFAVTITATQPDCDNPLGSATASPMSPNGAVSYSWDNGATGATITDLTPGEYCVEATDAQGCTANDCVTIEAFTGAPMVTIADFTGGCNADCGRVSISFTGAAPYELDYVVDRAGTQVQGTVARSNATGLETICPSSLGLPDFAGATITFTEVRDGSGCARPVMEQRTVPQRASSTESLTPTICSGTSFTIEGETFDAARPTGSFVSSTPNAVGCDSIIEVTLSFFPEATGTFTEQLCPGDTRTIGTQQFDEGNPTGMVVLPGASVNGCDSTVQVALTYFAPAASPFSPTLCPGDSLVLGGQTFTAAAPTGTAILPGASVNGCDSIVDVALSFYAPATETVTETICPGDSRVVGGQTFDFNNPTGEVTLPGASQNGCDSVITVALDFFPAAQSSFVEGICPGDTVVVGTQIFTEPVMDSIVRFPDPSNGCDSIVLVTVTLRPTPTLTLSGDGLVCAGDSTVELTLTPSAGLTAAQVVLVSDLLDTVRTDLSTLNNQYAFAAGGTVTIAEVVVQDACPVAASGSVTVTQSNLGIALTDITTPSVECGAANAGVLLATATGGDEPYQFTWSTGATTDTLSGLDPGNYSATVTDGIGCTDTATVNLFIPDGIELLVDTLPATCLDSLATIVLREVVGGVEPFLYQINGGGFVQVDSLPDTLRVLPAATVLEVEDATGCRAQASFAFAAPPRGSITADPSRPVIPLGDSVLIRLESDLNLTGFQLAPGPDTIYSGNLIWLRPGASTDYFVTGFDAAGCPATGMFTIITDAAERVFAPTAFSPNGDGNNDRFRLFTNPQVVSVNSLRIFDRWGGLVYEQDVPLDPAFDGWGWNGNNAADDRAYPAGVYTFAASLLLRNGLTEVVRGEFVLVR